MNTQVTAPSWDLSGLYSHYTDPKINQDLVASEKMITAFASKYRHSIASLSNSELVNCLEEIQNIWDLLYVPGYYLELVYEAGGEEVDKIGVIRQQVDEKVTKLDNELTFFDVEIAARPDLLELAKSDELKLYSNFLTQSAISAKYLKSEEVEKVLALKNLSGVTAWSKLYTDLKSKIAVEAEFEGEKKIYGPADLSNLLHSKDRNIRQSAFEAQILALTKNKEFVTEALNNIALDKKIDDEIRGYSRPDSGSLVGNQWNEKTIDAMIGAINDNLGVFHDYYDIKRQIMGLETLESYDVYGELDFEGEEKVYTFEEAKEIILKALYDFDTVFGDNAKHYFDNNLIDAQKRPRKYPGAFHNSLGSNHPAVVLVNFGGKVTDILTLAHELGHGIHSLLTNSSQNIINSQYTMSMAEIASLCSETIVFESLINKTTDSRQKLQMLCSKVEDGGANIFMAGYSRYNFEKMVHQKFRDTGALTSEQIGEIELEQGYKNLYGRALTPTKGSELKWQLVAHYTYDFYNYQYASGALTAFSIYKKLQEDKSAKEKYFQILRSGGSKSPRDLLLTMDMDIETKEFWNSSLEIFKSQVELIKQLAKDL